ncbi:UDP-glucose dehydrogenase family protein [Gottfriedia luciferensis]|uniref:UDP-glucose dehydrogenase family protein n=1 Tax=Gottfriedia luciferensis TaxID=178774 RepID=UPI000B44D2E9|nr:UDP-glucose/GDP-mannose dehydrogenase family protein [Gottfriedia luciferensis]
MNICVVGTGYVGLVSGTCFSEIGNNVVCIDIDSKKIEKILQGEMPIYEPGLDKLVLKNVAEGRLKFSTSLKEGMEKADVVIIAVGTPPKADGSANLEFVEAVAKEIGENLNSYKVIVTKSTVPVGTNKHVKNIISQSNKSGHTFDVASCPEFLREGSAIYDTMNMERAIIGTETTKAAEVLTELHKPFNTNIIVTSIETAEMIKYAANAFLAVKISFINEIANLAEKVGADVQEIAQGIGADDRIGPKFLQAGVGYGGSCFPKDVSALISIAQNAGSPMSILETITKVNDNQRYVIVEKIKNYYASEIAGKHFAVLGLAFKPNTDDMRDAPSIDIIRELTAAGAKVTAYDPVAAENAKKVIPNLTTKDDIYDVIEGKDAVVILTEWSDIRELDLDRVKSTLVKPVIFDGRNVFNCDEINKKGFYYESIGRKTVIGDGE